MNRIKVMLGHKESLGKAIVSYPYPFFSSRFALNESLEGLDPNFRALYHAIFQDNVSAVRAALQHAQPDWFTAQNIQYSPTSTFAAEGSSSDIEQLNLAAYVLKFSQLQKKHAYRNYLLLDFLNNDHCLALTELKIDSVLLVYETLLKQNLEQGQLDHALSKEKLKSYSVDLEEGSMARLRGVFDSYSCVDEIKKELLVHRRMARFKHGLNAFLPMLSCFILMEVALVLLILRYKGHPSFFSSDIPVLWGAAFLFVCLVAASLFRSCKIHEKCHVPGYADGPDKVFYQEQSAVKFFGESAKGAFKKGGQLNESYFPSKAVYICSLFLLFVFCTASSAYNTFVLQSPTSWVLTAYLLAIALFCSYKRAGRFQGVLRPLVCSGAVYAALSVLMSGSGVNPLGAFNVFVNFLLFFSLFYYSVQDFRARLKVGRGDSTIESPELSLGQSLTKKQAALQTFKDLMAVHNVSDAVLLAETEEDFLLPSFINKVHRQYKKLARKMHPDKILYFVQKYKEKLLKAILPMIEDPLKILTKKARALLSEVVAKLDSSQPTLKMIQPLLSQVLKKENSFFDRVFCLQNSSFKYSDYVDFSDSILRSAQEADVQAGGGAAAAASVKYDLELKTGVLDAFKLLLKSHDISVDQNLSSASQDEDFSGKAFQEAFSNACEKLRFNIASEMPSFLKEYKIQLKKVISSREDYCAILPDDARALLSDIEAKINSSESTLKDINDSLDPLLKMEINLPEELVAIEKSAHKYQFHVLKDAYDTLCSDQDSDAQEGGGAAAAPASS